MVSLGVDLLRGAAVGVKVGGRQLSFECVCVLAGLDTCCGLELSLATRSILDLATLPSSGSEPRMPANHRQIKMASAQLTYATQRHVF
jgi:hypothetical protein